MTIVLPDALRQPATALPELDDARTVSRQLVHRESLAEVFLTDNRRLDEDSYLAAAQLPRSHAYYADHVARPTVYDPVLLLETCRQAALAGAHSHYGVPPEHKFVLTHLGIRMTPSPKVVVGPVPLRLALLVTTENRVVRDGRTTGIDYRIRLVHADGEIGRAELGLRFKTPAKYRALRLANRDGRPLPSSADLAEPPAATAPMPYLVGRTDPDNVVLADVFGGDRSTARLRIAGGHPSMFDHPQDHVPGMVLAEAARQLAYYAAMEERGLSAAKTYPGELALSFHQFAEIDEPVVLRAAVEREPRPAAGSPEYTLGGPLDLDAVGRPQEAHVRVSVVQGDQEITTARVGLTRIGSW